MAKRINLIAATFLFLLGCSQQTGSTTTYSSGDGSSAVASAPSEALSTNIPPMPLGTKQTAVKANVFTIVDNAIYTSWIVDDIGIFPVDLQNGNIGEKMVGDVGWRIFFYDGWLYYVPGDTYDPVEGEGGLNKIKVDGSGRIAIGPSTIDEFWMDGNDIYSDNGKSNICKFKTDGSEQSVLYDGRAKDLFVYGNYIFYHNLNDNGYLYRIKTNGTENVKISENAIGSYYIINDWVYYSNANISKDTKEMPDGCGIYKVPVNGGGVVQLANSGGYDFTYFGKALYFINISKSNNLYKISLDNNEITKVLAVNITDNYGYSNGWLWYECEADGLYRCRPDGSDSERLFYDIGTGGKYFRGY